MTLCYGRIRKLTQTFERYFLYFMDKETEAQRGEITCLRQHSWRGTELGFKSWALGDFVVTFPGDYHMTVTFQAQGGSFT